MRVYLKRTKDTLNHRQVAKDLEKIMPDEEDNKEKGTPKGVRYRGTIKIFSEDRLYFQTYIDLEIQWLMLMDHPDDILGVLNDFIDEITIKESVTTVLSITTKKIYEKYEQDGMKALVTSQPTEYGNCFINYITLTGGKTIESTLEFYNKIITKTLNQSTA